MQALLVKHAERLAEGYTTVAQEEADLYQQLRLSNKLIMRKPQSVIDAEIEQIKSDITALFEEKAKIEKAEKMSAEKATEWAKTKQTEQQAAYNKAVAVIALNECISNKLFNATFW